MRVCVPLYKQASPNPKGGRAKKGEDDKEPWADFLLSDEDAQNPKHVRKAKDRYRKVSAKKAQKSKTGMQCPALYLFNMFISQVACAVKVIVVPSLSVYGCHWSICWVLSRRQKVVAGDAVSVRFALPVRSLQVYQRRVEPAEQDPELRCMV